MLWSLYRLTTPTFAQDLKPEQQRNILHLINLFKKVTAVRSQTIFYTHCIGKFPFLPLALKKNC